MDRLRRHAQRHKRQLQYVLRALRRLWRQLRKEE